MWHLKGRKRVYQLANKLTEKTTVSINNFFFIPFLSIGLLMLPHFGFSLNLQPLDPESSTLTAQPHDPLTRSVECAVAVALLWVHWCFVLLTGATALHMAAYHGQDDIVEALLRAGPDLTIKDRNGHTALHVRNYRCCFGKQIFNMRKIVREKTSICMHMHFQAHVCTHIHMHTHTCMHTRMHACTHRHTHTHTHIHTHTFTDTHTHTHTDTHIYTHTHTHTHTHKQTHTYTHTQTHIHIHLRTNTHTHTHKQTHTHTHAPLHIHLHTGYWFLSDRISIVS